MRFSDAYLALIVPEADRLTQEALELLESSREPVSSQSTRTQVGEAPIAKLVADEDSATVVSVTALRLLVPLFGMGSRWLEPIHGMRFVHTELASELGDWYRRVLMEEDVASTYFLDRLKNLDATSRGLLGSRQLVTSIAIPDEAYILPAQLLSFAYDAAHQPAQYCGALMAWMADPFDLPGWIVDCLERTGVEWPHCKGALGVHGAPSVNDLAELADCETLAGVGSETGAFLAALETSTETIRTERARFDTILMRECLAAADPDVAMRNLVRRKAARGMQAHHTASLGRTTIDQLLSQATHDAEEVLRILGESQWIVPGDAANSRFLTELVLPVTGPMHHVFGVYDRAIIRSWIRSLAG